MHAAPGRRTVVAAAGAAAAALILGLAALSGSGSGEAGANPQDALTLVRRALAALEVTPPDLDAATRQVILALLAPDRRGVDMSRVENAAHALGEENPTGAAADLMDALRPAQAGSARIDMTLLIPVRPRFAATPSAYALLAAAALLALAGVLVVRG